MEPFGRSVKGPERFVDVWQDGAEPRRYAWSDPRIFGQVFELEARFASKRMACSAKEAQLRGSNQLCLQFRVERGLRDVGEAEINTVLTHVVDDAGPAGDPQVDGEHWMPRS